MAELDFYVDGNRLCRWLRQQGGSWAGADSICAEPNNKRARPNLSPRTFLVQTGSGEPLVEWDFANSGLLEEVLVFDLERERMLRAGSEWIQPNRHYAIVCDRQCNIQGCTSDETFERNGISRKVIRLGLPLNENLRVAYKDFILWQPIKSQSDQQPHFTLTLRTPRTQVLSLNDRSKLVLEGLPEDAQSVELLIHKKTHKLQSEDTRWRTVKEVTITPELAARQRRVRVRFLLNGRTFTKQLGIEFNLLAAAMLRHQREGEEKMTLAVLNKKTDVNRLEGTSYLRIWTPNGNNRAQVFEENCRVGSLQHGKILLRDFPGHGGELQILGDTERHSLGIRCCDSGCVGVFCPSMWGEDAQLRFLSDKPPSDVGDSGYTLFQWVAKNQRKAKLSQLPASCVQAGSTERLWRLGYFSDPLALALTWRGSWLGAFLDLNSIRHYVESRRELRLQDFAIMKWLRLPILHPTLCFVLSKAILRSPSRFFRAWRYDNGLPESLRPHEHILGLDSVIRYFLWNDFTSIYANERTTLVGNWKNAYQEDQCTNHLTNLADISPILLWKGMEQCLKRYRPKLPDLLNRFIHVQVDLLPSSSRQQLHYRLEELENRTLRATGLERGRLVEIVRERFESMKKKAWHPSKKDRFDLLKLGEASSGRRYLSARMGQYWFELAHR